MARFDGGWVKLHRGVTEHWIGKNGYTLAIFSTLVLWANYKQSKIVFGGKLVTLERGQLLTTYRQIAEQLDFGKKLVERHLNLLQSDGSIVLSSSHRGTIITICNYEKFQEIENDIVPPSTHSGDSQETLRRQSGDTEEPIVKNIKTIKKVRKNILPTASPSVDDKPHGSVLWDRYSELYEKRHTVKPARSAKENSLCAQIIKQIGLEDALKTVEFYLASDQHAMYRHELPYFKQHIQRLRTDALSSKTTSLIEKYGLKAL